LRADLRKRAMTETRVPKDWYVIISGWIEPYLTVFATMRDPLIEPLPDDGPQSAKLTSSSFGGLTNYEEVLAEASELIQLMTGAMNINQDPGSLTIVNVVGIHDDGTAEKYPPHRRLRSARLGIPTMSGWVEGATPRRTFEQSAVLFARQSANPLVTEVLRFLALSPDWFGLYKALEVVRYDLNIATGKKDGYAIIVANGWASEDELDTFKTNVEHHRHWKRMH
jgi:hypothetical protein